MTTIRRVRRSEDLCEELLPRLPNDITLEVICPKLSWREFHTLSTVSPAWKEATQSHLVHDARVRNLSTETLVVVLHIKQSRRNLDPARWFLTETASLYSMTDKTQTASDHSMAQNAQTMSLHSTTDKSCNELPPIPHLQAGIPFDCNVVSLKGKIYVMGGLKDGDINAACSKVYVLDLAGQRRWKQCASMLEPRLYFGCCVKDGKIYVFGGQDADKPVYGSEVYDPNVNSWSPIKRMMCLREMHKVSTVGEELVVHGGDFYTPFEWVHDYPWIDDARESSDDPTESSDDATQSLKDESGDDDWHVYDAKFFEVYHPVKNEWRMIGRFEDNRLVGTAFTVQGKLYQMTEDAIYVHDTDTYSWTLLQSFSSELQESPYTVLAVNHELLAIVFWQTNVAYEYRLLQSKGFGNQKEELIWEIRNSCAFSWDYLRSDPSMCLIEI